MLIKTSKHYGHTWAFGALEYALFIRAKKYLFTDSSSNVIEFLKFYDFKSRSRICEHGNWGDDCQMCSSPNYWAEMVYCVVHFGRILAASNMDAEEMAVEADRLFKKRYDESVEARERKEKELTDKQKVVALSLSFFLGGILLNLRFV